MRAGLHFMVACLAGTAMQEGIFTSDERGPCDVDVCSWNWSLLLQACLACSWRILLLLYLQPPERQGKETSLICSAASTLIDI